MKFITILFFCAVLFTSCNKDIQAVLEPDITVVDYNYSFDRYMANVDGKMDPIIIKQRNIVIIQVKQDGYTLIEDQEVADSLIVSELTRYVIPNPEDTSMPAVQENEFTHSGRVLQTSKLVVAASYHENLNFNDYNRIRNYIYTAFYNARNEFALKKFKKSIGELIRSSEQIDQERLLEIKEIYPIRYTEVVAK